MEGDLPIAGFALERPISIAGKVDVSDPVFPLEIARAQHRDLAQPHARVESDQHRPDLCAVQLDIVFAGATHVRRHEEQFGR